MCTVVCRHEPDESIPRVRILALRDEFVSRDFDDPGHWWSEAPDAVGGRDRRAGGSWCVSDVRTGVTALLVNRIERFVGTPSRGLLPLAAVTHGEHWTEQIDHREMASFNLVRAAPGRLTVWVWDAVALARHDLPAGTHMITSAGIDADTPRTDRFAPLFGTSGVTPASWDDGHPWQQVVTACRPSSEPSALVVRHEGESDTYATVFGQLITATPGQLRVEHSRTPWVAGTWRSEQWPPD